MVTSNELIRGLAGVLNPERDYVLLDKAIPAAVESGSKDLVKYGVGAVGAGTAATLAMPQETEGATLPQSAIDLAAKEWRKVNPGKATSPEQWGNLVNIFRTDVPAVLGNKTPARDAADLRFLQEAIKHPDVPNLNPATMNRYREGMAALPEQIHDVPYNIKFLDKVDPRHGGSYSYDKLTGESTVSFNPTSSLDPAATSGHELGGHFVLTDPRHRGLFSEEQYLPVEQSKTINSSLESKRKNLGLGSYNQQEFNQATPEIKDAMIKDQNLYRSKPGEVVSFATGDKVVDALAKGREGLNELSDPTEYAKFVSSKAEDANKKAIAEFYGKPLDRSNETPVMASYDNKETSNIDTSPSIVKNGNNEISRNAMPANLVDSVEIPSGNIQGDFETGLSGAGNVLGGIGKAVGNVAWNTLKTAKKFASGGKGPGDSSITGEDYARAINAASLFFNPEGVVKNLGITAGFDVLDPSEANAELPDPAAFTSPQQFRTTPYVDRTIPEAVQNIALGTGAIAAGVLAAKSPLLKNEAGAINLKGFFSPLAKSIEDGVIGKHILDTSRTLESSEKDLEILNRSLKKHTVNIKDLPIAKNEQVAKDFFNA